MKTLALIASLLMPMFAWAAAPAVTAVRCPDGGIQPQVAVDSAGKVHLIYLTGEDGKNVAPETRMLTQSTGACGCCGMRLGIDSRGNLLTLYRAANSQTRDIYLAEPSNGGYAPSKLETVAIKTCPMSTMSFARGGE